MTNFSPIQRARFVVTSFYLCSVIVTAHIMRLIATTLNNDATEWDFLWPLYWVPLDHVDTVLTVITVLAFLSALATTLLTDRRLFRALFAILFLLSATIVNSYGGGINHGLHAWIFVAFILAFLPALKNTNNDDTNEKAYLDTIFITQALLAFFYTMSGAWKLFYSFVLTLKGAGGYFHFSSLSEQLANRILPINSSPLLADFVIDTPVIGWLGMLGVMYVQFTAIFAVFRPHLHVLWGLLIIFFHLGTFLLMEIIFINNVALLALLFLLSPFQPERFDWRQTLLSLPGVGAIRMTLRAAPTLVPTIAKAIRSVARDVIRATGRAGSGNHTRPNAG